jgi:hypothetical protein
MARRSGSLELNLRKGERRFTKAPTLLQDAGQLLEHHLVSNELSPLQPLDQGLGRRNLWACLLCSVGPHTCTALLLHVHCMISTRNPISDKVPSCSTLICKSLHLHQGNNE